MTLKAQLAVNREVGRAVLCAPGSVVPQTKGAPTPIAEGAPPAPPSHLMVFFEQRMDAKPRKCRAPHSSLGFSLTDLLVTVAVVLLILSVVVAAGTALRSKSRLARCIANLQQVDRAVLGFCNENNQTLPTITPTDKNSLWWWYKEQVKRYAGLTGTSSPNDTVFACPEDRGYSDPKPFCQSARFDYGSYVFNGVTMEGVPNLAGWELPLIKKPKRTLLVMEWTAHAPLSWHKSKTGKRNMPFYCDAESVVGFVDGHVSLTRIYYDGFNAAYTQDPIDGYEYQYSGN